MRTLPPLSTAAQKLAVGQEIEFGCPGLGWIRVPCDQPGGEAAAGGESPAAKTAEVTADSSTTARESCQVHLDAGKLTQRCSRRNMRRPRQGKEQRLSVPLGPVYLAIGEVVASERQRQAAKDSFQRHGIETLEGSADHAESGDVCKTGRGGKIKSKTGREQPGDGRGTVADRVEVETRHRIFVVPLSARVQARTSSGSRV